MQKFSSNASTACSLDRRDWLCRAAACALAGAPGPASAQAPGGPTGRLRDFLLMRGALDDRLVVGTLRGQYYAVVENEIIPLFGVISATFTRWRPLPDGRWLSASFEHAYYTDLASDEVMTDWRNPFNGSLCTVPVWTSQPTARVTDAALHTHLWKPFPGFTVKDRVSSMTEEAGEMVIVEQVASEALLPPPAKPYRYSEVVTLRAPLAALREAGAGVGRVPCANGFTAVSGWRPWLKMGEQPGHLMAQGVGRYGAEIDTLPAAWLTATRRLAPAWFQDPARHLETALRG